MPLEPKPRKQRRRRKYTGRTVGLCGVPAHNLWEVVFALHCADALVWCRSPCACERVLATVFFSLYTSRAAPGVRWPKPARRPSGRPSRWIGMITRRRSSRMQDSDRQRRCGSVQRPRVNLGLSGEGGGDTGRDREIMGDFGSDHGSPSSRHKDSARARHVGQGVVSSVSGRRQSRSRWSRFGVFRVRGSRSLSEHHELTKKSLHGRSCARASWTIYLDRGRGG